MIWALLGGFRARRWSAALVAVLAALILTVEGAMAQSYTFSAIRVEGNARIETGTVLAYAGIQPGQTVDADTLNAAGQKIRETGLFEEVELRPAGSTLIIRVVERPTINQIAFEGNRRIKDDDLAQIVQSSPRRVFSPATVEADVQAIVQAYAQQGRIAARVTPKIIRRPDNRVDLIFEIFEGDVIEVERISFIGNKAYSDRRLRRVLGTKQAGLLRALIRADTFVEDRIAFDRQVLRDFYLSRGYIDFRILAVNSELTEERDAWLITFHVEEGQQFRFGKVSVTTDLPDVDVALFEKQLRLKPGKVYSPTAVENVIARFERLAFREGLDFLRVEPRITRNDRDLTLDVEFALTRGPKIFIERIDISGNTTTLDRVIRRMFRVAEGDPFNPREIRESAERIRALGFFSDVSVEGREGTSPNQVIVDVRVEEQPTGSLGFGASYSTTSGFGANVQFRETNFLGRGQAISFSVATAQDARNYGFSFTEPAFLGRNVALGLGLSYVETDRSNFSYDTVSGRFRPSLGFPVGEFSRLQLRYTLRYSDILNTAASIGTVISTEAAEGSRLTNSLGYTFTYDTRGRGLDPNSGILFSFGQDFAVLGGDVSYIRSTLRAAAETKVMGEEVTLRATFQGGSIDFTKGASHVTDRFILGPGTFRGFEVGGIGPREIDTTLGVNDALGGHHYAVARLEAEFPLPMLPDEYGISGAAFYDVGSLWGMNPAPAGLPATTSIVSTEFELRQVIGFSILWDTVIGPLRFNFSRAIDKQDFDREQNFEFTIQTRF